MLPRASEHEATAPPVRGRYGQCLAASRERVRARPRVRTRQGWEGRPRRSRVRSSGLRVRGSGEAPGVRPSRELRADALDGLGTAGRFAPRARTWNHCAPSLLRPIADRPTRRLLQQTDHRRYTAARTMQTRWTRWFYCARRSRSCCRATRGQSAITIVPATAGARVAVSSGSQAVKSVTAARIVRTIQATGGEPMLHATQSPYLPIIAPWCAGARYRIHRWTRFGRSNVCPIVASLSAHPDWQVLL